MAIDTKIDLPPYDGTNQQELSEVIVGSASEFRGHINENANSIAGAINSNNDALRLWTRAWAENIGYTYWTGGTYSIGASASQSVDVGKMGDNIKVTAFPKLIGTYSVEITSGQTVYKPTEKFNGTEITYTSGSAISVTVKKVQTESQGIYSNFVSIQNNKSSGISIKFILDYSSAKEAYNSIVGEAKAEVSAYVENTAKPALSAYVDEELQPRIITIATSAAESVAVQVATSKAAEVAEPIIQAYVSTQASAQMEAIKDVKVAEISAAGDAQVARIGTVNLLLDKVAFVGTTSEKSDFEALLNPDPSASVQHKVYLWMDTGV